MTILIPKTVFVPFEWNGQKWIKRDDLPRFKEPEEAPLYWIDNPSILFRNGNPVIITWFEHHEPELIKEYLQGVGTVEYQLSRH